MQRKAILSRCLSHYEPLIDLSPPAVLGWAEHSSPPLGIPFACLKANKIPAGPERGKLRCLPHHTTTLRLPHCRSQHPESDDDITPPSVAIGSVNGMGCFHRRTRIFGTTKTVEVSPNFCSFLPPSALPRFHGDAWGSSVNHGVCALLERPKWPLAVKTIPIGPVDARAIRRCEGSKSPSFIS
jgi:hypothetical protein